MSSRLTCQFLAPSCTLSLLTAAILMAGTAPAVLAAIAEQSPARNMGDYTFSIARQPLVSALNAFTAVTGWQVGLPAELAEGVA
jgi:hemoglobin/transferrin/lactoferrin receptor protein